MTVHLILLSTNYGTARSIYSGNPLPVGCGRLARRVKFQFTETPNQWLNFGRPVPTRGAVARRHERGMGCGGRESVGVQVRSQGELNLVSGLQARKTNDVLAYGKTVWS